MRQKFLRLFFFVTKMRLLTLLLDAFSRSVNRKSSVTCESDLYRSDAVVRSLHGRTGIEEKDRL